MTAQNPTLLIGGTRTPFGKFGGSLAEYRPTELCVAAGMGLLQQTQLDPKLIEHVIIGNVIASTPDTAYTARHTAIQLGCRVETPAYLVNRLCGSGLEAILQAKALVQSNEAECVLVMGVENMSLTPHLLYGARFGTKYGAPKTQDLLLDALTDLNCQTPMGITAENLATDFHITREESDQFATRSHRLATENQAHIKNQITPYKLKNGKELTVDEHLRTDSSYEQMAALRTSFKKDGTVTPGNASGIVDGAVATLVVSEKFAQKYFSQKPHIAKSIIVGGKSIGVDPTRMGIGPSPAIKSLLGKLNLSLDQIDLFEINEAFAPQVLACIKDLKISQDKVNLWGGAIALGHPLGASGVRIAITMNAQLQHFDKKKGIASACIGGGQGIACLLERYEIK